MREDRGAAERCVIVPATLRDVSYIAANMRPEDWREIAAQCRDDLTSVEVAAWSMQGREAWVASLKDQPVAAFGVHPLTSAGNVLSIWAWGTRRMVRAVPAISRFIVKQCVPRWIEEGVTRVEARSIEGHAAAHRWMFGLGASAVVLPDWGKDREAFWLFSWTRESWHERARLDVASMHAGGRSSDS